MIYLITSESNQLINEYLCEINKDCDNILYIDFNNSSIDDILAEASYYSMFNEEKIIIVKNASFFGSDKISDENSNKLLNYFNSPNEFSKLIFTTNDKLDMRKKITKTIKDKYHLISIPVLKPRELFDKIRCYFKDKEFIILEESINYIIENNASNYDLIYNELEKIVLYYQYPCRILHEDVTNIVAKSLDANNFKFVDMIIAKEIGEAFKLYNDLRLTKVEPLMLIGLLAREVRMMILAKRLKEAHYRTSDIAFELGLQDWQLEKFLRVGSRYKLEELENRLLLLADLDLNIKTGKIEKWNGLANLIVDFSE